MFLASTNLILYHLSYIHICYTDPALTSCLPYHSLPNLRRSPFQGVLFQYKIVSQESKLSTTSLIRHSYSRPLYTCSNHPRARCQIMRAASLFQSSLKWSNWPILNLIAMPHLLSSQWKSEQMLLGTMSNKLPFQW